MPRFVIVKNGMARMMDARPGVDPADAIAKWSPADQAEVTSFRPIDSGDIPPLPQFKDAWRDNGVSIDVDMPVARTIHKDRLLAARDRTMAKRLAAFQIAQISNDTAEEARLRGVINTLNGLDTALDAQIDNAPNPAALDAVWHDEVER